MLTSLLSIMKYQSKMDMFLSSNQQMNAMISELNFMKDFQVSGHVTRDMASQFIKESEKKMIEISSNAPPVPSWLRAKAKAAGAFGAKKEAHTGYKSLPTE